MSMLPLSGYHRETLAAVGVQRTRGSSTSLLEPTFHSQRLLTDPTYRRKLIAFGKHTGLYEAV